MDEWKALTGRVTLFPTTSSSVPSALDLFRAIWGGEPDNFQRQSNALMPTIAQGKRGSITGICSVHPTRIDLSLNPAPSPKAVAEQSIALIEDAKQLHSEFERIIDVVGKNAFSNPVSRVALFLQCLTSANSFVEANKAVTAVLPVEYGVTLSEEEDFIFQVNQPRVIASVDNVRMNYIMKWSVERIQVMIIALPAAGMSLQGGVNIGGSRVTEFIAPNLVFDISTSPTKTFSFSGAQQSALLLGALTYVSQKQKELGLNISGF